MYSDSDDSTSSQLSQPHIFIKKAKSTLESKETQRSEDVVDRERSSLELISFEDVQNRNLVQETHVAKLVDIESPPKSISKPTNLTDKLLMKFPSNSSSNDSDPHRHSISSEGETSLGEVLDDEKLIITINKSQQTSPTLLNKLKIDQNLDSIDWIEMIKYASIQSLESTVHSPEIAQFQSKHLRLYYDQRQSIESFDSLFDSKLNLTNGSVKSLTKRLKNEDLNLKPRQYGIFNFDFDEELFYRVKKSFPQVSDEKIRTFMFKHHNQEHDVIAATINSLSPKREKRIRKHQKQLDKVLGNYIKMQRLIDQSDEERKRLMTKDEQDDEHNYAKVEIKIKYLKLLYPDVDVLELFYHLHNSDMKANNVAKKLEELGFKRKTLSDSEESLISSLHFDELMPELKLNFGEQQDRFVELQKVYPLIHIYLVKLALKSTKFNVNEARKLLDTVDLDQYKNLKTYKFDWSTDDSKYIYKTDRGTQTCPINYIEYGQTYRVERKAKSFSTRSKSTWTKEDNMNLSVIKQIAKGADKSNVKGPSKRESIKLVVSEGAKRENYIGCKSFNARGPNLKIAKGTDSKNLINSKSTASGPESSNCKGSSKNRPKRGILDDDSDDQYQNYFIKLDDLLPLDNTLNSLKYLSNY